MKTLIRGGLTAHAARGLVPQDILVEGERIVEVGPDTGIRDAAVFDARGMIVTPGLIDMHVHLREPGQEHKETIATGAAAAVRGGFTAVAAMPNTDPVADNRALIEFVVQRAARAGAARVYPIGAVTPGLAGDQLTDMAEMHAGGAVAFTNDGRPVKSAAVMRRAMQYARMLGVPIISHCEDDDLAAGGQINEGPVAAVLGLKGIPNAAEEVMVARDIILAGETGCALHICHVSTAGSVELVRAAKARGVPVTAEVTPHHFALTDEATRGYATNAKVNPPLRSRADVEAVLTGLADGTIDAIASDHAPHADFEKEVEFERAPFGLIGLETTVGLVFRYLIAPGVLTPAEAVRKMTVCPARILGLPEPVIAPGARADITVLDPEAEWVVDADQFVSKSRNTPFNGFRLKGRAAAVFVGGKRFDTV